MKKIAAFLMVLGAVTAVSGVSADAQDGGSAITTTTIGEGGTPTTTTVVPTTTTVPATTTTLAPALPPTGSNGAPTAAIAGVLLAAGAGLFGVSRLRSRQATTS